MTTRPIAGSAALALALAGCGGDDSNLSPIVGMWMAELDSADCAHGFAFEENGDYEYLLLCTLTGGGLGAEVQAGTYELDGDSVTITTTHATCTGGSPRSFSAIFDVDGDRLRLTDNTGVLLLQRTEDDGGGMGGATFGCFDKQTGAFTPGALERL